MFGSLCFPCLKPYAHHKLDPRSTPCVFLGYSPTQSAYFCLDRQTSGIYTSRHVVFHEYVFPFTISSPLTSDNSSVHEFLDTPADSVTLTFLSSQNPKTPTTSTPPAPPQSQTATDQQTTTPEVTPLPDVAPATSPKQQTSEALPVPQTAAPDQTPKHTSNRLKKPIQKLNLTATIIPMSEKIPTSVAEALKDPRWRKAMYEELEAMARNRTWDLTDAAAAANIVGCKWVFTIKRHPDGSIDRFKA